MNILEYEMIELLKRLKNDYGVFEIKAEFEAEGSRMEELMRLKDITSFVGLPIILKIGGVEAVTDIYNALSIGVKGIIAPMAETPYALSKFIKLIKTMIAEDNAKDIEFAFNMETITGYKNIDNMLALPDMSALQGVTIGRVDLAGSLGIDRNTINESSQIEHICKAVLTKAKAIGLHTGMGGCITKDVLPIVERFGHLLDKFETRKVVFPAKSYKYGYKAIQAAQKFELSWLKSKQRYYSRVRAEDEHRIKMLEGRINA